MDWNRTSERLPECPEATTTATTRFVRVLGAKDGIVSEYTYEPHWEHGWTRCGKVTEPPTWWMYLPQAPAGDE